MQFNSHATNQDVVSEINDICNSDNNSYPIESKTRRVNSALDRFFTLAFQSDGRWNFDDLNQTAAPIESISLVSGTQAYDIDDFASEIINTLRLEVTDEDGNKHQLTRLDRNGVQGALTEYQSTNGTPKEYDLIGNMIYLYPAPNYSASNALTVYFERNKSAFTTTDTTKSLGIPSIFDQYICRYASLPYLIEFQKGQKNDIANQIQIDEQAIQQHFNSREKGVKRRMTVANESSR